MEGSRPEWCISSMVYSGDTPFWSETLNLLWTDFTVTSYLVSSPGKVEASTSKAEDPRFDSRLWPWDLSVSSHTSDLTIGTPVAALPSAWHYRVSAGAVCLLVGCLLNVSATC